MYASMGVFYILSLILGFSWNLTLTLGIRFEPVLGGLSRLKEMVPYYSNDSDGECKWQKIYIYVEIAKETIVIHL